MALQMIEGFETQEAISRPNWSRTSFSWPAGRFGGKAMGGYNDMVVYPPQNAEVVICGFAWYTEMNYLNVDLYTPSLSSIQARMVIGSDRLVKFYRGGGSTLLWTGSSPVIQANAWHYIEIKARIASAGGLLEIRVDGVTVGTYVGNTMNAADSSALVSTVRINNITIDDFYLCDGTGDEFNNYLGEIQVETLVPNANGSASQLTGSDGNSVDNYLLVDEFPMSETDYAQSVVAGARDLYGFTNLIQSGQILAVQPEIALTKGNAGPAYARIVEKVEGTERKSIDIPASNLLWKHTGPKTRDPRGLPWTTATVNAAEFGVEVV